GYTDGANLYRSWFVPNMLDPFGLNAIKVRMSYRGISGTFTQNGTQGIPLINGGSVPVRGDVNLYCDGSGEMLGDWMDSDIEYRRIFDAYFRTRLVENVNLSGDAVINNAVYGVGPRRIIIEVTGLSWVGTRRLESRMR